MGVPSSQLKGKKVYTPDGTYQGEVIDLGFVLGSGSPLVIVKASRGGVEIPWAKIAAAKDIVILAEGFSVSSAKEVPLEQAAPEAAPSSGSEGRQALLAPVGKILSRVTGGKESVTCPTCGKQATWIRQYNRWYCHEDKKYI